MSNNMSKYKIKNLIWYTIISYLTILVVSFIFNIVINRQEFTDNFTWYQPVLAIILALIVVQSLKSI